jgi:hypothetical protein
MKNYLLLLLLAAFPLAGNCNGDGGPRYLKNVKIEGDLWILLIPSEPFANPDGCGRSDAAIVRFSDASRDVKMSMALTAFAAKQKVQTYFVGCIDTHWGFSFPYVYSMVIGE